MKRLGTSTDEDLSRCSPWACFDRCKPADDALLQVLLDSFYRFAQIDGRIASNPAQYVRRPKVHTNDARGLDRSEPGSSLFTAERSIMPMPLLPCSWD